MQKNKQGPLKLEILLQNTLQKEGNKQRSSPERLKLSFIEMGDFFTEATTLKQKAFSCSVSLRSKLPTTVSDHCFRSFAKIRSVEYLNMHI